MIREHFPELFKYNDWANRKVLVTLENNEVKNHKIQLLLSHLLSSQIVWFNRIKNLPTTSFPLWEIYKLTELRTMMEKSTSDWLQLIDNLPPDQYQQKISYQNTKGQKFENSLGEIISHVINHSTYHRGQIALLLREENIEPPVTDLIAYARK